MRTSKQALRLRLFRYLCFVSTISLLACLYEDRAAPRRTAPQLFTVVELQELGFSHGFSDYLSQSINYHGLSDSPQEECTMLLCVCPTADRTRCALCEVRDVPV